MPEKVKSNVFEIADKESLCFGSTMATLRSTGL